MFDTSDALKFAVRKVHINSGSWVFEPLRAGFVIFFALRLCGCAPSAVNGTEGFRVRHLPPTDRDLLAAMLTLGDSEMTDSSCDDVVDPNENDHTVGAYLSVFLQHMSTSTGGNYLTIERISESADAWIVRTMLGHSEGVDEWRWGIEFAVSKKNGAVDLTSIRCIGAG